MVGVLLLLLGLASAGLLADFVVENPAAPGAEQAVQLFGRSFRASATEVVIAAAAVGAIAILLIVLGIGFLRGSWGRRRSLRQRVRELVDENAALRSKLHLAEVVRVDPAQESPTASTDTPDVPPASPEEAPRSEWKPTTRR